MKTASIVGVVVWGALIGTAVADKPAEVEPPAAAADPQFIEADDWFLVPESDVGKGTLLLGKKRGRPVDENGLTSFVTTGNNAIVDAKVFFKTRIAKPEDVYVGRTVIYPKSKIASASDKEYATVWNSRRIASLADAKQGKVLVTGSSNRAVDITDLRVIVGAAAEAPIKLTGKEDAHSLHPEHWLVYADSAAPDPSGHETRVALPIQVPAKPGQEGTFLVISTNQVIKTKHAYRSRVATKADLKAGLRIALWGGRGSEVPRREDAYEYEWFVGSLTSYDNNVAKLGNHTVRVELLRVILP